MAATGKKQKKPWKTVPFCSRLPQRANPCQAAKYPLGGVEQRDQTSGTSETPVQGGTVDAENSPLDLQLLIQAWPTLSQQILPQQIMRLLEG